MPQRLSSVAAVALGAALSALFMVASPARAQGMTAGCVNLEVQNVRPGEGTLMVAAYGDAATFSKSPLLATQMRVGPATTMAFPLCGLTGVDVALTLYQDLNGNGKLDANAFGIPSEPWGASGKPHAMMAPTWEMTVVPLGGSTIVIKLSK